MRRGGLADAWFAGKFLIGQIEMAPDRKTDFEIPSPDSDKISQYLQGSQEPQDGLSGLWSASTADSSLREGEIEAAKCQ